MAKDSGISSTEKVKLLSTLLTVLKRSERPCILFLGSGASVQSGTSNWEEVVDNALKILNIPAEGMDFGKKYVELCKGIGGLGLTSPDVCNIMKWSLQVGIPSGGYIKLGGIIRGGFFDKIFTTNWDSHLVEALDRVGVDSSNVSSLVYGNNSPPDTAKRIAKVLEFGHGRVKIVKLHGDLNECNAMVCQSTFQFQEEMEDMLARQFSYHLLIVGTRVSDLDIVRCIKAPTGHGNVWFVNPEEPDSTVNQILMARNSTNNVISGKKARFDAFFDLLARELGVMIPKVKKQRLPVHPDLRREYAVGTFGMRYRNASGKESKWTYQIVKLASTRKKDFTTSETQVFSQLGVWARIKCPECGRDILPCLELGLVANRKMNLRKELSCRCGRRFLLGGNFSWLKQF